MESNLHQPPRNNSAHAAMHPPWRLGRQSAVFFGERPFSPNIVPVAQEMCSWLQQKGHVTLITESERGSPLGLTNPYSYSASSLAAQLCSAINEMSYFINDGQEIPSIEAELRRIRLESELTLQFARFCEASIKQMLYCTAMDANIYNRATMGRLLAFDCPDCRKSGTPHFVSLLGALAHHYYNCTTLETCLFDHLAFIGTRRNKEAAHSEAATPRYSQASESRIAAKEYLDMVGHELGHMCQHIGEIESKMIVEIKLWILHFPNAPSPEALMRIPVRVSDVLDNLDSPQSAES